MNDAAVITTGQTVEIQIDGKFTERVQIDGKSMIAQVLLGKEVGKEETVDLGLGAPRKIVVTKVL